MGMLRLQLTLRPSSHCFRTAISLWNRQRQQQYQQQYQNRVVASFTSSASSTTSTTTASVPKNTAAVSNVEAVTDDRNQNSKDTTTTTIPFHIDPSSWTQPIRQNERRSYETIQALIRQRVYERETYMINTHFDDHQNATEQLSSFQLMQKVINHTIPSQQELDVLFPIQSMDWNAIQQYNNNSSGMSHVSTTARTATNTTTPTSSNNIQITWMGHSTVLIQYPNGINVVTDPIFSQYCSPIQGFGPKRYRQPPCTIQDLLQRIPIHLVILSHNHYDHFDYTTIKAILQHNHSTGSRIETQFVVPLGLQDWFHRTFSKNSIPPIYELDWYEYMEYYSSDVSSSPSLNGDGDSHLLRIRSIPMKHWSNRYMYDRDRTLWCGYSIEYVSSSSSSSSSTQQNRDVITTEGSSVVPSSVSSAPTRTSNNNTTSTITTRPDDRSKFLFMGDTGYYDAMITTNCLLGPYNYAAIPIGAYEPRSFMKHHHLNVMEAVQIYNHHLAANSNSNHGAVAVNAVPIHWGTFPLTTEPVMEPRDLLLQYMRDDHQRQNLSIATATTISGSFVPWLIGETKRY